MSAKSPTYDIAVIGAGIAGASVAAELSQEQSVVLLDMEAMPGYHTTGRSAAVFAAVYGPAPIRALTRASEDFFLNPPEGFATEPLFHPRPILMIARPDQQASLAQTILEVGGQTPVERLDEADLRQYNPLVKEGYANGAMLDVSGQDIDVAALHQGYLRQMQSHGGQLLCNHAVVALTRNDQCWEITTQTGTLQARVIVNAAGAWAERIGQLANAEPIGLVPKRRTAALIDAPEDLPSDVLSSLPITIDIDEAFYLKPDAGRMLMSPADETPFEPCDVQPGELDIALCADRIQRAFDLRVQRIASRWAGLRSFVADKCPVVGYSQVAPDFFWLAGQGGFGIQSAPALSRLAGSAVLGRPIPDDIAAQGLIMDDVHVSRLALGNSQ